MKISVICGSSAHPVVPCLRDWVREQGHRGHEAGLFFDLNDLTGGDLLFIISFGEKLGPETLSRFKACLVLHASDLPDGAGWSPHIWSIIEGQSRITVTLFEAEAKIDTGRIWFKKSFDLAGTELLDEINQRLFETEIALMTRSTSFPASASGSAGRGRPAFRRRTPEDSRLDPDKPLSDQFDLLRTVDNEDFRIFAFADVGTVEDRGIGLKSWEDG